MADILCRRRSTIYNYGTYNTALVPLDGERRYFDGVITDQQNDISVLGNGTGTVAQRPFLEVIRIHATGNVDLNDLRLAGNRVLIYNATAGTINVNINTTGTPVNVHLVTGRVMQLYFDGTRWTVVDCFVFHATGNISLADLRITGTRVMIWNSTAGTITVNINTAGAPVNINLLSYHMLYVYFDGSAWRIISPHKHNTNSTGRMYMLQETERPAAYILAAGNAVVFTDIDFSAYAPAGAKLLWLYVRLAFLGDGALDSVDVQFRQNGSGEADVDKMRSILVYYTNLGAGTIMGAASIIPVLCDTNRIVEYCVSNAAANVNVTIYGYNMEDDLQ